MKKLVLLFMLLEFSVVGCTRALPQPNAGTVQATPNSSGVLSVTATTCPTPGAPGQATAGPVGSATSVSSSSATTGPGTTTSGNTSSGSSGDTSSGTSGSASSGTGVGDGTISPEQAATQQALFQKANRPGPTFGTAVVDTDGQTPGTGSAPSNTPELSETPTLPPGPGTDTTPPPTNKGTPILPVNPGPKGTLVAQPCP